MESANDGGAAAVPPQHSRARHLAHLKLQGELVGRVFGHVFEVGVEVVELHQTESRARAMRGGGARAARPQSHDHCSPGQLPLLQCRLAPASSRHQGSVGSKHCSAADDCSVPQSTAEYCGVLQSTTENCKVPQTTSEYRLRLQSAAVTAFVPSCFHPDTRDDGTQKVTPNRKLCHQQPVGHAPAVSTHFLDRKWALLHDPHT